MSFVVGLTGGIACGKSTIARDFVARGAALIDADLIAREVVEPGSPALPAIAERFGAEMFDANGRMRRAALGKVVFSDHQALADLNAILHPQIESTIRARVAASKARIVLVDAALLIELGLTDICDLVVVVWAQVACQVQRIMQRNGLSEVEARQRVASQAPHSVRLAAGDVVIDNSGTLDQLEAHLDDAWSKIQTATEASH